MPSFLTTESQSRLIPDRWLFVLGLATFTTGQGLTYLSRETVIGQQPVDFIHWAMLIGALMMIPFSVTLPRTFLNRIASPLLILGIAGIIGMAVIDFVLWTYGFDPGRDELARQLMAEPSVWLPFIVVGPGWIFATGLALASLYYLPTARLGTALVLVGVISLPFGGLGYSFISNAVIALGFAICFWRTPEAKPA